MFVKTPFKFNNTDLRRYFERSDAFNCWIYAKHYCYLYVYFDERTFDAFIVDYYIQKKANVNKVLQCLITDVKKLDFDFLYSLNDLDSELFQKIELPNVQYHFGDKYTYNFLLY